MPGKPVKFRCGKFFFLKLEVSKERESRQSRRKKKKPEKQKKRKKRKKEEKKKMKQEKKKQKKQEKKKKKMMTKRKKKQKKQQQKKPQKQQQKKESRKLFRIKQGHSHRKYSQLNTNSIHLHCSDDLIEFLQRSTAEGSSRDLVDLLVMQLYCHSAETKTHTGQTRCGNQNHQCPYRYT